MSSLLSALLKKGRAGGWLGGWRRGGGERWSLLEDCRGPCGHMISKHCSEECPIGACIYAREQSKAAEVSREQRVTTV